MTARERSNAHFHFELRVTSDGGLILVRELDERLGFGDLIAQHQTDSRHGKNTRLPLAGVLRRSVYRRLVLPKRIEGWSLTSLQQRLVKTGGRLIKHAR